MKKYSSKYLCVFLAMMLIFTLAGCRDDALAKETSDSTIVTEVVIGSTQETLESSQSGTAISSTEHVHLYSEKNVSPTCMEEGYTLHTCECGDEYESNKIDALGHFFGDWKTIKKATTTESGLAKRKCENCAKTETKTLSKIKETHANHFYKEKIVLPTCTQKGYTTYTCSCGSSYKDDYIDANGHSFSNWKVVSDATCTNAGLEKRSCINCDYSESRTTEISHDYESIETKPTCENRGYTTYVCKKCEASYIDDYTSPIEHDLTDWKIVISPTCTKEGEEKKTCKTCSYSEVRDVAILEHQYTSYLTTEATCKEEGTKTFICECGHSYTGSVSKLEHIYKKDFVPPTCTQKGYAINMCLKCGDTYIDNYIVAQGHHFENWNVLEESTCIKEGIKSRNCKNCELIERRKIELSSHNYEVVVTAPTCAEKGYSTYKCSICKDEYKDDYTDTTEHAFGAWTITVFPTHSEKGVESRRCQNCDYSENRETDLIAHTYTEKIVAPTCTEQGYTLYTCEDCGDSYKANYTDMVSHNYTPVVTTPTCTKEGYTTYTCAACGDSYVAEYVPSISHEYTISAITPPTCEKDGFTTYTCNTCGRNYDGDITEKLAHDYEYKIVLPSCNNEGYTEYICVNCGDTYITDILDKLEHDYEIEVVEPTCVKNGQTVYTCSVCKYSYVELGTALAEHSYGEWETVLEPTVLNAGIAQRSCSVCANTEKKELSKVELRKDIVAYYVVVDGAVVDIVSGNIMSEAVVDGNYFSGGKVVLPSSYERATIETIMMYNRTSTDKPIGDGLSYYGGAFMFQEVLNPSNWGLIKVPFGGGQIGTNFILNASLNHNKPVLRDGDSYWCLAFDKQEGAYALQINNDYVEKSHWSNYINRTFKLSSDHKFKEFIVYNTRLSADEMASNFIKTGIELLPEDTATIGRVTDGIAGLGSAFAFSKAGTNGLPKWVKTNTFAGNYSLSNGNGLMLNYNISNYVEPDKGVDNSAYESLHIIKKPESLCVDYKYALSAVPYPFNVNHEGKSDQYDVSWTSSNPSIAMVIDGLIIPQKTGTVTITSTLKGTNISDSCTIRIVDKDNVPDKALYISENYISDNGHYFSNENYEMTTNAIYDAITEAYDAGYNHVIFPKIDFYAAPTGTEYYIPTGMTVEFPKGSVFHMMPNAIGKANGYTYFRMGWGWWSCAIPTEKASAKKDVNGNVLAYYCRDAHLIIDKYYGEFYKEDATMSELSAGANEYAWGCVLLNIGKRAEYCTVEIREANCPSGFFITMGGKGNSELVNGNGGSVTADNFVSGWLDDSGDLVVNNNWISTSDFFTVSPSAANGMDTLHEYYIGDWEHNVTTATQRLYDILWFDEDYALIQADRWQYVDEGYKKPSGAKYFKLSIQQTELPSGTNEYVRLCPDESSRFCEIKNTNVINGADGLASVVGATEACWIHDNYVSGDGLLKGACWSLDLEDGWQGMRGTIIEHNIFRKYAYSSSIGDYRGMDTGILALSSGYNTFVISNYLGAIAQTNWNVANTHIINNVIYTMYSSISGGRSTDIRAKIGAHVYYNIIEDPNINENTNANGIVYHYGNTKANAINKW